MSTEPGTVTKSKSGKGMKIVIALVVLLLGGTCCIGVGSAIALPAFINYLKRSKSTEARVNVRSMQQGLLAYCAEHNSLPPNGGPLPTTPSAEKRTADFTSDPGFSAIGFNPASGVYYSYAMRRSASGMDLVALGDLDGDGVLSEYTVTCNNTCACGDMLIQNELE